MSNDKDARFIPNNLEKKTPRLDKQFRAADLTCESPISHRNVAPLRSHQLGHSQRPADSLPTMLPSLSHSTSPAVPTRDADPALQPTPTPILTPDSVNPPGLSAPELPPSTCRPQSPGLSIHPPSCSPPTTYLRDRLRGRVLKGRRPCQPLLATSIPVTPYNCASPLPNLPTSSQPATTATVVQPECQHQPPPTACPHTRVACPQLARVHAASCTGAAAVEAAEHDWGPMFSGVHHPYGPPDTPAIHPAGPPCTHATARLFRRNPSATATATATATDATASAPVRLSPGHHTPVHLPDEGGNSVRQKGHGPEQESVQRQRRMEPPPRPLPSAATVQQQQQHQQNPGPITRRRQQVGLSGKEVEQAGRQEQARKSKRERERVKSDAEMHCQWEGGGAEHEIAAAADGGVGAREALGSPGGRGRAMPGVGDEGVSHLVGADGGEVEGGVRGGDGVGGVSRVSSKVGEAPGHAGRGWEQAGGEPRRVGTGSSNSSSGMSRSCGVNLKWEGRRLGRGVRGTAAVATAPSEVRKRRRVGDSRDGGLQGGGWGAAEAARQEVGAEVAVGAGAQVGEEVGGMVNSEGREAEGKQGWGPEGLEKGLGARRGKGWQQLQRRRGRGKQQKARVQSVVVAAEMAAAVEVAGNVDVDGGDASDDAGGAHVGGVSVDPRVATWIPPASPWGLIEEALYDNPWRLLVACMLLNRTTGRQVRRVLGSLWRAYPDPAAMAAADLLKLQDILRPLGLQAVRAARLRRFSWEYEHTQWSCPNELHGVGQYAADAYHIFCRGAWREVQPTDRDLRRYRDWLANTGGLGSGLEREDISGVLDPGESSEQDC